jgi:UDP-GlcNAc:undecaprenyl-phosphate GlcNAc-1-phosphate transferase
MDLTPNLGSFRYVAAFLGALLLALYFTPLIRRGAIRYGVVDNPDGRLKQHREPIAYLGGVAVYLAFLFALAFTYDFTKEVLGLLLAASIVMALGLFDDLKVLSPGVKLAGQVVAALVLVKAGILIRLTFLPDGVALALTVFWLVGVTNALNLIDVSDGLAAGCAAIAGLFLYIVSLWNGHTTLAMVTLALVGAALGFLAYNRPPARIFLGDTGSMFLGFMLGALAMSGHYTFRHRWAALAPVVILGVPIFDTLYVMGVRWARGIPLMRGSPDHFAVRMRNNGYRAGVIAATAYGAALLLGGAGLALCLVPAAVAPFLLAALAAVAVVVVLRLRKLGRGPAASPGPVEVAPGSPAPEVTPRG